MRNKPRIFVAITMVAALLMVAVGFAPTTSRAASHREAPLIAMDPEADITDFYMFRSYETARQDNVVLIMNVIPAEEPSAGPNYYNFDPNVLYSIHIDNNVDGFANDVRFDVQFRTELRGVCPALGLPLSYIGNVPPNSGAAIPAITKLDGPGSEGFCLRQKYTVTMTKGGNTTTLNSSDLIAVPSNVGPRTMPDYDALAAQGIYNLGNGIRVFAGQRDDPFFLDLGAIFDSLNLRNPGTDMLSGFNVHTIALEVPASLLTSDSHGGAHAQNPVIGGYSSTSRRQTTVLNEGLGTVSPSGPWVQIQRLANPLVNEVIIPTDGKDRWNFNTPDKEATFLSFYLKPRFALALQLQVGLNTGCTPFGDANCQPNPPAAAADLALSNFNRTDLVNILLKYKPSDTQLSELLRLDLRVPPRPLASQKRLTILAGDNAGWPNGRRPIDDVIDVAVQVVGGPLYIGAGAGDNVDVNDKPLPDKFPFIASPWDGRNRVHKNP